MRTRIAADHGISWLSVGVICLIYGILRDVLPGVALNFVVGFLIGVAYLAGWYFRASVE